MWNYFRIQLPVESARSQLSCETDLNISPTHQVLMRVSLYQEFYQCAVKFESGLISVIYGHKQKCHNITNIQWNTNTVTWPGENRSWQAVISTPLPPTGNLSWTSCSPPKTGLFHAGAHLETCRPPRTCPSYQDWNWSWNQRGELTLLHRRICSHWKKHPGRAVALPDCQLVALSNVFTITQKAFKS